MNGGLQLQNSAKQESYVPLVAHAHTAPCNAPGLRRGTASSMLHCQHHCQHLLGLAWLGHTCTAVPHPAGSGLARLGVPEAAAQMAQAGSKGKGGNLGSEEGGKKSEGEKPAVQQPVRASTRERKPVQRADA